MLAKGAPVFAFSLSGGRLAPHQLRHCAFTVLYSNI